MACFDFIASLSYQHDQTINVRKTLLVSKDDMNSSSVSTTKVEKQPCLLYFKKNHTNQQKKDNNMKPRMSLLLNGFNSLCFFLYSSSATSAAQARCRELEGEG